MIVLKILFVFYLGFFAQMAVAGKAYDDLIKFHQLKIEASTDQEKVFYNDQIHGILGGSRGFSSRALTDIEKRNATYVSIHAALTTPETAEKILLEKVFTDTNLMNLDNADSKIITHYVNLTILYLATKSAETLENHKVMIEQEITRLCKSRILPENLKRGLRAAATENEIIQALERLNFGEIYAAVKRQLRDVRKPNVCPPGAGTCRIGNGYHHHEGPRPEGRPIGAPAGPIGIPGPHHHNHHRGHGPHGGPRPGCNSGQCHRNQNHPLF